MFFQLPEIERIESRTHQMGKQKQQLSSTLGRAYSQKNKVQGSVNLTIDDIIEKAKHNQTIIKNIEDEAENGFLIPQQFNVSELVYDRAYLPEWFEFVFQKQFTKQKKNFDIVAKKLYAQHCLNQKKNQLSREIKSFQTLYGRYKALGQFQKNCLNIMGQAQTLKNKSENIISRFSAYLELVSNKLNNFVEQNVQKSLNYTDKKMNNVQPKVQFRIPYQPEESLFERKMKLEKNSHKYGSQSFSTKLYETNPTMAEFYPVREPPLCPHSRLITHSPLSHHANIISCQNHHRSTDFDPNRYNYKNHMPRWMNKTLSDYYF